MIQRAVITDLGGLANHHAHSVIDKQSPADARSRMNFNAGQYASDMRHEPAGEQPAALPKPMRQAVIEQRLKPRVAEHNLEARPCRGVARERGVDFIPQVFEQHCDHYMLSSAGLAAMGRTKI